jgi:hypothetical protein
LGDDSALIDHSAFGPLSIARPMPAQSLVIMSNWD